MYIAEVILDKRICYLEEIPLLKQKKRHQHKFNVKYVFLSEPPVSTGKFYLFSWIFGCLIVLTINLFSMKIYVFFQHQLCLDQKQSLSQKWRQQALVRGFNPFEKYQSKSSPSRGENKTYLKPPPREIDAKNRPTTQQEWLPVGFNLFETYTCQFGPSQVGGSKLKMFKTTT